MKINHLLIIVFICSTTIFSFTKRNSITGSISGEIIYQNQNLQNVIIQMKNEYKANLNFQNNSFYIANMPEGTQSITILVHDPVYGNFKKKIENITVNYLKVTYLGDIILTEQDAIKKNPIILNYKANEKIIINDFSTDSHSLLDIKKQKKNILLQKQYWEDSIRYFAEFIYDNYEKEEFLKNKNFIYIVGHVDPLEKNQDKKEQKILGYERAKDVFIFLLENFRIPEEAFLLDSAGADDPIEKKKELHPKNKRVEIIFYRDVSYY